MKEKKCTSCRFAKEEFSHPGGKSYSCRRHAPHPPLNGEIDVHMPGCMMVCWPFVNSDDWCGEFEEAGR